jgi:hypothetical protein
LGRLTRITYEGEKSLKRKGNELREEGES